MSSPQSNIFIVGSLPIDNRYEHTFYFKDRTEQDRFFFSKVVKSFYGYTYIRPNWSIKVQAEISDARRWSYLYFKNQDHEDKWYYYFITKVDYINESTVELHLEMDVIQTYMFDWTMKQCFVERMHTRSDKIGDNTIDEGLETGPLINALEKDVTEFEEMCILYLTTVDDSYKSAVSNVYDGVFSGLRAMAVDMDDHEAFGEYLDQLSADGKIDSLVSMWMYPKNVVATSDRWSSAVTRHTVTGAGYDNIRVDGLSTVKSKLFGGYQPKNNKLYTYPYNMLYATNNNGASAIYRYERFRTPNAIEFGCSGAVSPDASVKIYPYGYNGIGVSYEDGLSLGGFPSCAWDSDVYKVWLAQNQHTQELGITQAKINSGFALAGVLGSALTGNVGGAVNGLQGMISPYMQIQGIMAQRADMEVQPNQARGNHSSNVNVANGKQTFTFYYKSVTAEFARCIDDYFTRYGYKINRVMTPSLKTRDRFTYVKTLGCTVSGSFGNADRLKIESIFDKGITFWSDTFNPCDYTNENNPL